MCTTLCIETRTEILTGCICTVGPYCRCYVFIINTLSVLFELTYCIATKSAFYLRFSSRRTTHLQVKASYKDVTDAFAHRKARMRHMTTPKDARPCLRR